MEEIVLQIIKYVAGVSFMGLIGNGIKMYLDNRDNKKDIAELKKQRAADLIEFSTTKALAASFEQKLEGKIKDVMHEYSEQRHKDILLFTNAINQMKEALIEVNSTLKHLGRDVEGLKRKDNAPGN